MTLNDIVRATRTTLTAVAVLAGLLLLPGTASASTTTIDRGDARDARAAVADNGKLVGTGAGIQATWTTGSLAPGQTDSYFWNNVPTGAAYQVGLSPFGASSTTACHFETTRTGYLQQSSGEVEFHFTIKNIGAISCATDIWLTGRTGSFTGHTGTLAPNEKRNFTRIVHHNSATRPIQMVALAPIGAFGTSACRIDRQEMLYRSFEPGEWAFVYTLRNTGSISCSANIYLAAVERDSGWSTSGQLLPGQTYFGQWNNANPLSAAHVALASPLTLPIDTHCELQVVRSTYRQVVNPNGAAERELLLDIRNTGAFACNQVQIYLGTL